MFKFFWPKTATHQVEKWRELHENQLGTRPRCSAEYPALIDEFVIYTHILTSKNIFKLQNDTTVCFDRMIITLITLCSPRFHVPDKACKLQADTLRAMQYHMLTSQGWSRKSYSNTDEVKSQGTLQGSGASCTYWLFNIVSMFQVLQERYVRYEMSSIDK